VINKRHCGLRFQALQISSADAQADAINQAANAYKGQGKACALTDLLPSTFLCHPPAAMALRATCVRPVASAQKQTVAKPAAKVCFAQPQLRQRLAVAAEAISVKLAAQPHIGLFFHAERVF